MRTSQYKCASCELAVLVIPSEDKPEPTIIRGCNCNGAIVASASATMRGTARLSQK